MATSSGVTAVRARSTSSGSRSSTCAPRARSSSNERSSGSLSATPSSKHDDVFEFGQPVALLQHAAQLFGVLDETHSAGGVREEISDLRGCARRVDGHADRADGQDPEVGFLPLRPVPRQDRDPIAEPDAQRGEAGRRFCDGAAIRRPRRCLPCVALVASAECDAATRASDALREHVQNRRVRWPEPGSADKLRAGSRAHHLLLGDRAPAGRQRDNSPAPSLHLSEPRRHGQRTRMRRPDEHLRRTPLRYEGGGPLWIRRPVVAAGVSRELRFRRRRAACRRALPFTCCRRREGLVLRGPEGMDEAGDGQQRQQRGDDVGHGCDLLALHAEDAEPERGEQQPTEGLALEEAVTLCRDGRQLLLQVRQGGVVGRLGGGDLGPRARSAGRRGRRRSGRRRSTGGAGR